MSCRFLFLLLIVTACFGCKQARNNEKIKRSYSIIRSAISDSYKIQDTFFGKAVELLGKIKDNKDVFINTDELVSLLDNAKMGLREEIRVITLEKEPDLNIKYKTKALKVAELLRSLYDNEFSKLISVLNSKSDKRFETSKDILYNKMTEMQTAMYDCRDAGRELRNKYDITEDE